MFEYPEINTLVKQMKKELTGKTVKSGALVKKNGNMFMSGKNVANYSLLAGGTIMQIDHLAPEIYVKFDNGYGIMIRQSGGKILYNKTPADLPKNCSIIFEFTDASSLTYTMSLFTLVSSPLPMTNGTVASKAVISLIRPETVRLRIIWISSTRTRII